MNTTTTARPAPATAVQAAQSVAVQQTQDAAPPLHKDIEQRTEQFQAALPAHIPVERFKRVLLTAISANPELARADRRTLFTSAVKAAQDGLLPDGREGALVIYKTKIKENGQEKWVAAVQWMPMIAGIRKKVRNSGEIVTWDAQVVFEKDEFDYMLGDNPQIHHKPFMGGDRGKMIAAYSIATLKSGERSREVMSASEIMDVWRKASKQKDKDGNPSGPWKDHPGEMWRKTVARRHSKVLPMSTDLDDLIRRDDNLYDLEGASDKEQKPPRPQLADFTESRPAEPEAQDTPAQEDSSHDPATGEIKENPIPEFSAADAHDMGSAHRFKGGMRADCPKALLPDHADAWRAGFDAADDDMKESAKGGK